MNKEYPSLLGRVPATYWTTTKKQPPTKEQSNNDLKEETAPEMGSQEYLLNVCVCVCPDWSRGPKVGQCGTAPNQCRHSAGQDCLHTGDVSVLLFGASTLVPQIGLYNNCLNTRGPRVLGTQKFKKTGFRLHTERRTARPCGRRSL